MNAKLGVISEICCTFAMTIIFRFPQNRPCKAVWGIFFVSYAKIQKIYDTGNQIVRFFLTNLRPSLDIAEEMSVPLNTADSWLRRLIKSGVVVKGEERGTYIKASYI